jgi:uncharacterized protein (TIGR02147 family)
MSTAAITQYDFEDLKILTSRSNYREFILSCIEIRNKKGRRFGYSDIARRGAFKSRSFPREVALGKKNLTHSSLQKFVIGLGLKGILAEYFRALVELETPECRTQNFQSDKLENKLRNLRSRLLKKSFANVDTKVSEAPFELAHIPQVYAALGLPLVGATLSEIKKRTSLPIDEIATVIEKLLKSGFIEQQGQRYLAKQNHLNLPGLKQSQIFKEFFLKTVAEASMKARSHFDSDEDLFFSSSFSVKKSDLRQLKNELREVLLRYVDDAEKPQGDSVVSMACALFR